MEERKEGRRVGKVWMIHFLMAKNRLHQPNKITAKKRSIITALPKI